MTNDERPRDGDGGGFDFWEWKTGRVFYTADPHLGHERIIQLCNRPFRTVAEMNDAILDGINSTVSSRDTLVILGDALLGRFEESVKLLKKIRAKRIWMLPGNHDRWSLAYSHHGSVETVRTKRQLFRGAYEEQRAGIRCEVDRVPSGWRGVVPLFNRPRTVLVSHYPYVGDSLPGVERHQQLRPVDAGLPLIHGHVHTAWRTRGRMFNVGVDVNGFKPVSESMLGEWLESLPLAGAVAPTNGAVRV